VVPVFVHPGAVVVDWGVIPVMESGWVSIITIGVIVFAAVDMPTGPVLHLVNTMTLLPA
jgi:hypothetical protein